MHFIGQTTPGVPPVPAAGLNASNKNGGVETSNNLRSNSDGEKEIKIEIVENSVDRKRKSVGEFSPPLNKKVKNLTTCQIISTCDLHVHHKIPRVK